MKLSELQEWVKEDWDKKSKKQPDSHLQLIYLFEELGEMAEAIRKSGGDKKRKKMRADIGGELGDVIISIATIANHHHVDLDAAVSQSQTKIARRHKQGL